MTEETPLTLDVPSPARIYDYALGGTAATPLERDIAGKLLAQFPALGESARANRAFLVRLVRFLATECGIRQFIDLGSGLPTTNNVHEVVRQIAACRVVYVDRDPSVVLMSGDLLATDPDTAFIPGDICEPGKILAHPVVRGMIDLSRPVAILAIAVLHFIPDAADPEGIVARLAEALPPGGYLALSIASRPDRPSEELDQIDRAYHDAPVPPVFRRRKEIDAICSATGLSMVDPGLVEVKDWPTPTSTLTSSDLPIFAAVFRK